MTYDPLNPASKRFSAIGDHKATILKKVLGEGAIKVYTDPKGASERVEISLNNGKVVIYKDYQEVASMAHFKKIEIYSTEEALLDSIDIVNENPQIHTYIFYFHKSAIGRGSGDIAMNLAQSLVGESVDPRYLSGSSVDSEVIKTIQKILEGKSV